MADKHESAEDSFEQIGSKEARKSNLRHTFENGQLSCLDCDLASIPKELFEDYCNITSRLDLSFNRLVSLEGLEHFKYLKELVLDSNELHDNVVFPVLKELHTLTLNKNKLTDLPHLLDQLVSSFSSLTYLSLLGNEACPNQLSSSDKDDEDYQRYRYYVLYRIPRLKFLDSTPVTAFEVSEAKRIGPYQQIVRPTTVLESSESSTSGSPQTPYTPLPSETQEVDKTDHRGTFGKSKYIYYGRHSEGNRFIRNKDL